MLKAVNGALEVQIARGLGKRSSGKSKGRKGGELRHDMVDDDLDS